MLTLIYGSYTVPKETVISFGKNIIERRELETGKKTFHFYFRGGEEHPQSILKHADYLIGLSQSSNVLVTTYQELILLRVMKRMRHTAEDKLQEEELPLTPAQVTLLYVNTDGKSTWIEELELDDDGSLLDPWPGGFFEEGHNERFE